MGRPLDSGDIASAAKQLDVTEAHVRAVVEVEASGAGFLGKYADGPRLPKILFEAHIFSRETGGKYDKSHPRLSAPKWNRNLYQGGIKEHDRIREAARLEYDAAFRSASWGLFQIMGFNHKIVGYDSLHDFVGVQYVSEGMQLRCGIEFIRSSGLDKYLSANDWARFARGYNGKAYKQNRYDQKLAEAYKKYNTAAPKAKKGDKDIQRALNNAGFSLAVDGKIGPRTTAAIREFQDRMGLRVDGIVGPNTRKALGL
ncbi:MAG: DUF3380 domain-containing protein [Candidatus Marinimicrobia bacterium]|nr:DUF3380 domain-containing protein [Candidatus Neomarinimicrobiota bacterium]